MRKNKGEEKSIVVPQTPALDVRYSCTAYIDLQYSILFSLPTSFVWVDAPANRRRCRPSADIICGRPLQCTTRIYPFELRKDCATGYSDPGGTFAPILLLFPQQKTHCNVKQITHHILISNITAHYTKTSFWRSILHQILDRTFRTATVNEISANRQS